MYFVLSAFPVYLLAPTKASVFFFIDASAQYINIISINQKPMRTTKFQAILVYLNPPKDIRKSIVEEQWH